MKLRIENQRSFRIHQAQLVLVIVCMVVTSLLVLQLILRQRYGTLSQEIPGYSRDNTFQRPRKEFRPPRRRTNPLQNVTTSRVRPRVTCHVPKTTKSTVFATLPFFTRKTFVTLLPRTYTASRSIHFTREPMYVSHAPLNQDTHESLIYMTKHPLSYALDAFQKEYQVVLNDAIMSTTLFRSFVLGKVALWRIHFMYWYQLSKSSGFKNVTWVKVEDLVRDFPETHRSIRRIVFGELEEECGWVPEAHILDNFDEQLLMEGMLEHGVDQGLKERVYEMTKPWLCILGYNLPEDDFCDDVSDNWLTRFEEEGEFWIKDEEEEKKVYILTTYFEADSTERQAEIDTALRENVNNLFVEHVFVWIQQPVEFPSKIQQDKMTIIESPSQPLYHELFDYANKNLPDSIVIIQNTDIHWTPTLERVHSIPFGMVYAISRQTNVSGFAHSQCPDSAGHNTNFCTNYHGSHDAFIFRTPIDISITRGMTIKQNTWGAENVVISGFKWGGWRVENPCYDIVAVHVHCSGVRRNTGGHVEPQNGRGLDSRTARPRPLTAILG